MRPSVGLAMIVRDCGDTLGVCLQSVIGLFDDIVLVDTGSVDDTKDVAKRFGARIFDFQWCDDFSAARNYSWEQMGTDLICWLDGDDLLLGREYFPEMVEKMMARGLDGVVAEYLYAFDAVGERWLAQHEGLILSGRMSSDAAAAVLKARCVTTQWRERVVRNIPGWNFQYPIHEALPAAGRRLGKYEKVKVIHRRHVRKNPVSASRNLDILLKVPPEKRDERIWFYLGLEHGHHQKFAEAVHAFETYLPLSTVPDEKYLVYHFLGDLYRVTGEVDTSILNDLQAVAIRPTWRDAYAGLLESYVRKGDWPRALYYGVMAKRSEVPDTPFAYNPLHEEVGWVGDYIRALVECGQVEEAQAEADRALSLVPEDSSMQHNLIVLSVLVNVRRGKQSLADAVEFLLRHDDAETAAVLLGRLPPEHLDHPDLRRWVRVAGSICGPAARGEIPADRLKRDPAVGEGNPEEDTRPGWVDPRTRWLRDRLGEAPEVRRILQVGGPLEMAGIYRELGLEAGRIERIDAFAASGTWDAVVLWGCLGLVKKPDDLVERARSVLSPGGMLYAMVPNGPATRGAGPPDMVQARLRAFSVDTFRRVVGTYKMPDILPGWLEDAGDLVVAVPTPLPEGRSRTIGIVCPMAPEEWGPSSLGSGIGGSEEAVIRLSRAFARRGHHVAVYGSGYEGPDSEIPDQISYRSISRYEPCDVVIGWRYPEIFLNQVRPVEGGWRALWLHDSIGRDRVESAAPLVDRIWTISDYHASLYQGIPNVYKGRNGIDPWEFDVQPLPERNPAKCVWSSTPFRGLDLLLARFWPEIKSRVPEAELHVFYGWNSADRMGVTATKQGARFKAYVMELVKQPGVVWRGRVGQPELYREFLSSGVWSYSSTFREENCLGAAIAQASGAWPVVLPEGALGQSVVFGWKVTQERFVDAVVEAIRTEGGRDRMAQWARRWLSWDDCAAIWERLWLGRAT